MEGPSEAQWAPDPYRRHELRYWDGTQWTEHVSEGDGSVLVDPPLPGPRTRREAAMASSGSLTVAPAAHPAAYPAASSAPSPTSYVAPSAPSFAPSPEIPPAMAPVVIPAAAEPAPAFAPAQTRAGRRTSRTPDLFNDLPGGRQAAGAVPAAGRQADLNFGSAGPGGPVRALPDGEPEGWDWRESHIPEILSGLGVAALIAVAAVLGGGSSGSSADAVQSVVSTPTGEAPAGSAKPAATKKPKKKSTVPGVQLSSAKAPRITYRSSSSAAPRATTTSRTRTTSAPPTSSTPPDANTSTSATKSSSPSDTASTNDSTPSSSTTTTKKKN